MKKYEIICKTRLAHNVNEYVIYAPLVARHCLAGQFIILRVDEDGERVPFTICDYSRADGTVSILVQEVGYTTYRLSQLCEGDCLCDFVGPLGNPTDLSEYKDICLIGGGIGSAVIYPQAKALYAQGKQATCIIGARNKDLVLYKERFEEYTHLNIVTDDGSLGEKGFVTDMLQSLIDSGSHFDLVFAVGPLAMMKAVSDIAMRYNIPIIVSMNSMMVDGTGMCGCCRLSVGGETKYACVDGPEFDGSLVDFDEAILRSKSYREHEHACYLRRDYAKE